MTRDGKPLVIEGFCGMFGWSAGWLELGGRAIGFDIEHLAHHGPIPDGAELFMQDALTVHGRQFKNADLLLMSPPCTEFSYMAMPWKRAKQIAGALREECPFPDGYKGSRTVAELTALFDACFRIQREACEAAGHYIPMVVENVRGAQPWVGKAKANFGSFYLWGDVDMVRNRIVTGAVSFGARSVQAQQARKVEGFNFHEFEKTGKPGGSFQSAAVDGLKIAGYSDPRRNGGKQRENDSRKQPVWFNDEKRGVKNGKDWFGPGENCSLMRSMSSRSDSRKAASAQIAKIPLALSRYIASAYLPQECRI